MNPCDWTRHIIPMFPEHVGQIVSAVAPSTPALIGHNTAIQAEPFISV